MSLPPAISFTNSNSSAFSSPAAVSISSSSPNAPSPSASYFLLSDLNKPIKLKVNSLRGRIGLLSACQFSAAKQFPFLSSQVNWEFYVELSIFHRGDSLSLPCSTSFSTFSSPQSDHVKFGSWITFPVKYRDLAPTARIAFTVYAIGPGGSSGVAERIVGGSSFPLFSHTGKMKLGRRKLFIWPGQPGDGEIDTKTPHNVINPSNSANSSSTPVEILERRIREFDQKELPCVKWLDKLALRRIEKIQQQSAITNANPNTSINNFVSSQRSAIILSIEFPAFHHPIVYHQKSCNPPIPSLSNSSSGSPGFLVLFDSEMTRENPVQNKYHKLARSSKGLTDRDLKPNIVERKELQSIISSPNKRLTIESKELVWKFRFSLVDDKRALTKFLRAVNWSDVNETRQALDLLEEWSLPDIADALELLSKYFTNEGVRIYAVKQLQRADDEELSDYLLQLVQALRYENSYPSSLSQLLIDRALKSFSLCNFFHWYVTVEISDQRKGAMFGALHEDFLKCLKESPDSHHRDWYQRLILEGQLINSLIEIGDAAKSRKERIDKKVTRMKSMLSADGEFRLLRQFEPVHLAVKPEVRVVGIVGEECTMFKSALAPMLVAFKTIPAENSEINPTAATTNTPNSHSAPHPSADTSKDAAGKSSLYKVIFKRGDDLRQDQLVISMINLMDSLLKKVKLDLQLTPYRVLATGATDGFVEYVPGTFTLTSILDQYSRSISDFFHKHHHSPQAINRVLDTFVKSSAGYSVITYILGIGDRHLDNVLLTSNGNMIHIDFSFLFGRDPKPFPPPMKFSKEMVLAMGGADSEKYLDFQKYCVLAFNILRQHASLILNLLSLMGDANIPDLSNDVEKNLLKVQEKFRLDLNDEEAGTYILSLIDQSVSALFPQVMEKFHRWALYWK